MRLEPDRRHLVLPVVGRLRCKENTRRLQRLVVKGRARILSMTLSEQGRDGGRLVVSVQAIVCQPPAIPTEPEARCGIDLGIGREWAVIAHSDGTIQPIAHPAPWAAVHQQRRRVARQRSRRIVGSRAHRQANAKLAALDRRAANLRAHHLHTLTTQLARRYGTIVVEDLNVAAMARGMGRRGFRRGVAQAGIGKVRRLLAYKCAREGGRLVVADRWFASSKTHHGCGGYRADLRLGERVWHCPSCGRLVDRNANAALNLRDWTGRRRPGCPAGWSCRPGAVRGRPRRAGSRCKCGRARPWKTTARWRGPTTPEPSPGSGSRGEESRAGVPAREHHKRSLNW